MGLLNRVLTGLGFVHEQYGKYYVYELLDTRFDPPQVFYVGSGGGERVFEHEKETRNILASGLKMKLSHKHKTIIAIWDAGLEPGRQIIFRSNSRCRCYQVESKYIAEIGLERLANQTYGWSKKAIARCLQSERV